MNVQRIYSPEHGKGANGAILEGLFAQALQVPLDRPIDSEEIILNYREAARQQARMRGLTPLPKDTEEMIDDIVVNVGLSRLQLVADLRAEGLVVPMPNWLSVLEFYYRKRGQQGDAIRTMEPTVELPQFLPDETGTTLPIFATMSGFKLPHRELLAARRKGVPFETGMVEDSVIACNRAIEDQSLNGAGVNFFGNGAPGLLNEANINTYAYSSNEAWTAAGHDGADITNDVESMVNALIADGYYGPYNLYVNPTYGTRLQRPWSDSVTTISTSVQGMIEQMTYGGRGIRVRTVDFLGTNRTILVQMTNNVIDLIDGQEPVALNEPGPFGMGVNYAIVACQIVRVKSDKSSNSGVCAGNTT